MCALGERVIEFVRVERPGTLIECPVEAADEARLRNCVRQSLGRALRLRDEACVALFAGRVAARAGVDQHSFRAAFLDALGVPPDIRQWDNGFGPAIESFLRQAFGHEPLSGPYRYVGPVYRHAGVTVRDAGAFARFLQRVLDESPALRRDAYTKWAKVEMGRIGPFLQSREGYEFSQATVRFLAEHKHFGQKAEWLSSLGGYPTGFWPAFLSEFGGPPPRPEATPPVPRLVLDVAQGRLVVRFDAAFVSRGAYFVDTRPVRHAERAVNGPAAQRYETGAMQSRTSHEISPWWTPSVGGWALFREGDGALVLTGRDHSRRQDVPSGRYVLVGAADLVAPVDGDDYGYLDPPDTEADCVCLLKQLTLEPGCRIDPLGISSREGLPSPELAFQSVAAEPVFFGVLPKLRVIHWPNDGKFRLVCDLGATRRGLAVPPGTTSLPIDVPCPSCGAIRVEYLGVDYHQRVLPTVSFTLLPAALRPTLDIEDVGPLDPATVRVPRPEAWTVTEPDGAVPVAPGSWVVPAGTKRWAPTVSGPGGFKATLPIAIPLSRLEVGLSVATQVLCAADWKPFRLAPLSVQGRKWQDVRVAVSLGDQMHDLLAVQLRPRNEHDSAGGSSEAGWWRGTFESCLDRLQSCALPVGRLVVVVRGNRQLRQGFAWLSPDQWELLLDPFTGPNAPLLPGGWSECLSEAAPELASDLEALLSVQTGSVPALRLESLKRYAAPLLPAAARLCLLAQCLDSTSCDLSRDQLLDLQSARPSACVDSFLRWWEDGDDKSPDATFRWARWQRCVEERRAARWLERNPVMVVRQFRDAVLAGEPSASPLAGRPGHSVLFQGAGRLFRALARTGEARIGGLVGAQGMLAEATREVAGDMTIEGRVAWTAAATLEAFARLEAGLPLPEQAMFSFANMALSAFAPALNELREKAGLAREVTGPGVSLHDLLPL